MIETLVAVGVMLGLIALRMPIALAMGLVGFFGFAFTSGLSWNNFWSFNWDGVVSLVARTFVSTSQDYGLSVLPLFIAMGNFVAESGISQDLYRVSNNFLGARKGGLAMATILACAGFSSICGSSLATAATMSKVALPSMRKYGYSDELSSASIAAGGTLGILIPPSVIMIIYGILAEASIRDLFIAGIIPGIIGIVFYMLAAAYTVWRNPDAGPASERVSAKEKLSSLAHVKWTIALFVIVMGGLYAGVFTPTEAGGVGAFGAFLIMVARKKFSKQRYFEVMIDTGKTTASLFSILFSGVIFGAFVTRSGVPQELTSLILQSGWSPLSIIFLITLIYVVLGMFLESLSIILLTVPLFYPIVTSLGFDVVWFGIVVVVVTEIGLITPPIGLNLFVLSSVAPDIPVKTIVKGIFPFVVADIIRVIVIILIPPIVLFLPRLLS